MSHNSRNGESALGLALWPTFSNLVQDFDPEGKMLSPEEIEGFLKQHPDARLVLAFRGTNVVYFSKPNSPRSAHFYPNPAGWAAVFSYDTRFSQMRIEELVPLDKGGRFLTQTTHASPRGLLGGTLPTKARDAYRRWTDWQIEGYWLLDEELIPIGGFKGQTKEISWDQLGYSALAGQAQPIEPEEVELLSDADVLSLLNGEQK